MPNKIDEEWLKLILQAKRLGLTIDEVRDFLNNK
ncbi:anti-repressor SinI family protein [Robertmurraya sp. DFI.2.37]|nr:anti-repressor SinI family protein [Robertmurraya sp. DFI.2.37]